MSTWQRRVEISCKWCGVSISTVTFEDAEVCDKCYQDGILAKKNPHLCNRCKCLFVDKANYTNDLYSNRGVQCMTKRSARSGCGLCRMILLQDPNPNPNRIVVPVTLFAGACRVERPDWENGYSSHDDVDSMYFSTDHGFFSLLLSISARTDDPAAKYVSQRPISHDLKDEATTQQIRSWISECFETHEESLSPTSESFMPTRVIDVAAFSGENARLIDTGTLSQKYVTLSYCWGTIPFITTKLSNLKLHQERIDISALPQTFKDAIVTTKNMGFRYLWIDALCIIQDSTEDKAKEICQMGDIYMKAAVTIAVVSSSGVTDGFLKPKPLLEVELPYLCLDGIMGSIIVSPQPSRDLRQEPLYTRGWCLQENLLSPRLLLFTASEVLWQCQSAPMRRPDTTHVAYEKDNPDLKNSVFHRLPHTILSANPNIHPRNVQDALGIWERFSTWTHLVENYTRRRVTVASDRLPALAGIAQKFEEAWSDTYYFGIWKTYFISYLSWSRDDIMVVHPRLDIYRAPSWSWASVDGPITFSTQKLLPRYDHKFKHLEAVFLDCVYKDSTLEKNSEGSMQYLAAKIDAIHIRLSEYPRFSQDHGNFKLYLDNDSGGGIWTRRLLDGSEFHDIAWLCCLEPRVVTRSKKIQSIGVLLLLESDIAKGSFTRIGYVKISGMAAVRYWTKSKSRRVVSII